MPEDWYSTVEPTTRLTQGDLIFDCPLVGWRDEAPGVEAGAGIEAGAEIDRLRQGLDAFLADAVVMTQACDLEHEKVANVVLCPNYSLTRYKELWEATVQQANQVPTPKSWKRHCDDISKGLVWNLAILNSLDDGPLTTDREHLSQAFARFFMRVGLPTPVVEAW